jgi:hypothetical protein
MNRYLHREIGDTWKKTFEEDLFVLALALQFCFAFTLCIERLRD